MSTITTDLEEDLKNGVVAVFKGSGEIQGTGFVAGPGRIVTCAHVVKAAGSGPGRTLNVSFATGVTVEARVDGEAWCSPEDDDVAVLNEVETWPPEAKPLPLGDAKGSVGHSFRAFGYPPLGDVKGVWATGEIKGRSKRPMDARSSSWPPRTWPRA